MQKKIYLILFVFCLSFFVGRGVDAADGDRILSFMTNASNDTIFTSAMQSDGKIIIGGYFTTYSGVSRDGIARLNADGSLDTTFDPGTGINGSGTNGEIWTAKIQPDGKILIGGSFTSYNGTIINNIARINTDGSLDSSFIFSGTRASDYIFSIDVQADNKIVIGGQFTTFDGIARNHIARLNADGSLDTSFDPGVGADGNISVVKIQSDGKILIGGYEYGGFTTFDGIARNHIARLNADGSLDTTFDPGNGIEGTYDEVGDIGIQSDGKIIIGGAFDTYDSVSRKRIVRVNADGSLDTTFDPGAGGNSYGVNSLTIQSDGKIVIGGWFTTFNGISRNRIARLNRNGSLDATFDPGTGTNSTIQTLTSQLNNEIVIVGWFATYNDVSSAYIAKIESSSSFGTATINTSSVNTVGTVANAQGVVVDTGGENPSRYIQWGETSNDYTDFCSAGAGGSGIYSCEMNDLILGQTYYIRAYVTNSYGTTYGDEIAYTHIKTLTETIIPHEFIGGGVAQGWQGDEETWSYQLPFDFPFYNTTYTAGTSIGITSNGQICLEDDANCVDYENDIVSQIHGPFITPLWTDLDSSSVGDVYITETPEYIIIRWETEEYDVSGVLNFEAILYSNGNIKFNYDIQNSPLENVTATVGISNGAGAYVASVYDGQTNFNQVDTSAWGDFTSNDDDTPQSSSQSLSATIQETLTLNCGSNIDLDSGTTLIPGTPQTNITTCTVTTNDSTGYDLQLANDRGSSNTLYHQTLSTDPNGQIQDKTTWNPTAPNAISFTGDGLAFGILSSTASKNESWWGNATTCTDTNQLYAGIPQTDTTIMEHTSYSNASTDTEICYQVNVPSTQIAGEYTGSVTYTATGRP